MTLNANILLSILTGETDSGDHAKDVRTTKVDIFKELVDGTGANQAQVAWSDSRVVAPGGYDNVNLRVLTDDRGTISITAVKAWCIRNTGPVSFFFGAYGTSQESYSLPIGEEGYGIASLPLGGVAFFLNPTAAGWITNSPTANFVVFNSAGQNATYDIVFIGEGAIT